MTHAGLDFLRWLYPTGPWVLTAIDQNQQLPTRTATFHPNSTHELLEWVRSNNSEQWNIYYSVNKLVRDVDKKAKREDIAAMCFLHVDIDPRVGEKFDDEKERILKLFGDKRPNSIPEPSAIIYSGGGYNALWRLQEQVPISDEGLTAKEIEARYEDAKRYNLQLEIVLGGDNCHNVDRILRLPGTTNWPNAKKRAKGRVPVLAELVYVSERSYPLTRFVAAAPVQSRGGGDTSTGGGVRVNVSGNVKRLQHISELGEQVSDRVKMIIVQGFDPDEPNKFSGRSEWLFYVCCSLVRAGVDDETIYSVITDPGFMISASVLDKGSSQERYAKRQIQRAKEDAIHPSLRRLNERFAVIGNIGGKCRVIEDVEDHALQRSHITMQSFEDFRNRYLPEKVQTGSNPKNGEPLYEPLGHWWLKNPNRRQFDSLVFVPGHEVPGAYNMWKGFACVAKPGDKHQMFLDHIRNIVCNGVEIYYDYLVKWMARAVQHPDTQGEVAVVFRGDMGVGKGTVASQFGKLWGRHFLHISDPKHLVGNFNAHLRDSVIVFADEAFYAGDKKHESILKTLITEDTLAIEGKHVDVVTSRNYIHLMIASNSQWVVPAGMNERRYFVLEVIPARMRDRAYFGKLYDLMDSGGRENLLHYLLTLDISDYEVRNVPQTEALRDQKLLTLSTEQEWWYQKLENGMLTKHHVAWTAPIFKDDLIDDYLRYAQKIGVQRRATATAIGRFLQNVCPPGWPRSKQRTRQYTNDEGVRMLDRQYAYEFPSVEECRAHWDKKYNGPYPWTPLDGEPNGTFEQERAF